MSSFNEKEYRAIRDFFEVGFSCKEISIDLQIELKTVVTYLSRYLNTKKFHQ